MIDSRKYVVAFAITALIFGTAIFVSNNLSQKKLNDVRAIENRVRSSRRDFLPRYWSRFLV